MKAQLVKRQDRFDLYNESDGSKIASTSPNPMGKLSLKNCQAIKNGYDLDELINRAFDNMGYHSTVTPHEENQFKLGYRIAFREALEILGDKKFSENEMWNMFYFGDSLKNKIKSGKIENKHMGEIFDDYIQSLQQNEWDVTFNPEEKDSKGCLILKRL